MQGQFKSFATGLFILVAMTILVWVVLALKPQVGDEKQTLYVRFVNLDKITEGTRVGFAGQPIGVVGSIQQVEGARNRVEGDFVYIYQLILKIDSSAEVYTTDQISIRTSGLLGERSIEITPMPRNGSSQSRKVVPGDVLYALPTGSVEEALGQISKVSTVSQNLLSQISDVFSRLDQGNFWKNLSDGTDAIVSLVKLVETQGHVRETLTNLHLFSEDMTRTGAKIEKASRDLVRMSEGAIQFTKVLEKIAHQIGEGEGTLGKLLVKDDLYLAIRAFFHKADTIMGDINHYGFLYHNDKRWQRVRAKRASKLAALSTPQEFQNFFSDELGSVTTALDRVYSVVQQVEGNLTSDPILNTQSFKKVFSELLRRVESLQDQLKSYNVELETWQQQHCGPN